MKTLRFLALLLLIPSLAFGWTYTANMDSYTTIGSGFSCENNLPSYGESVTLSGAPSPTKVLHGYYYPGTADAREPFDCYMFVPVSTTEFYFQYYFKYGSNWLTHPTINKHMYFMTDSANHVGGFFGTRKRSGDNKEQFVYAPASVFGEGYRYIETTVVELQLNTWYKVTGWVDAGDPGVRNAQFKLWVNDTLQINTTGLPLLASDSTRIIQMTNTPVWGGNVDLSVPSGGMDIYFDSWVVSSDAIGGTTVDASAPYVDTFSPSDGTTGVDVDTTSASFHVKDAGTVVSGVDITSLDVGGKGCASCASCDAGLTCSGTSADYTITRTGLSLSYDEAWSEVITVSDIAGNAMSARTYNFTVEGSPNPTLTVSTTALNSCTVGDSCSNTLSATGGVPAYTWDTSAGTVPPGLSVPTSGTGAWGVPTTAGTFTATYRVTDSAAATATKSLSLTVVPADPGGGTSQSTTFADTYINSGSASTNYADNTALRTYQWPAYTVANRTLIMDNTLAQSLTAGKNIDSAKIRLWLTGYDGSGGSNPMVHHVYCSTAFDTTTATWTNFDSTLTEESTTNVALTSNWYDFDVTACFRTAYQSRLPMYVAIDGGSDGAQDTNRIFAAVDHATEALRPQLSVVSSDNIAYLPPNPPSGHYVQAGDGQVVMYPGTSSGALFYSAYYAVGATPTKSSTKIAGVVAGQALTGLTNNTAYHFAFTASNANGESGLSDVDITTPVSASVVLDPPAAPTYGSAVALSGAMILSPGSSAGATSYNAYYTSDGSTPSTINGTAITGVTSGRIVSGLTNGTTYKVVYTAVNAAGESGVSGMLSVTPQTTLNVNFLLGRGNGLINITEGQTKNFVTD